jgi:creatinine amidohydrolase
VNPLPQTTSVEVAERAPTVAVLPIGSFEQHGRHLPLTTDTLVACAIAEAIAERYDVLLLPPIAIACSHEHADFAGTVSISATTLVQVIRDVQASLDQRGIRKLALINGHGGNYVLSNVVQEANVGERRMVLFPGRDAWTQARKAGGLVTDNHEDMHGGELETSILLHAAPEVVRPGYEDADHVARDRPHLLTLGMAGYTDSGLIGRPSLATPEKGDLVLADLTTGFADYLASLTG